MEIPVASIAGIYGERAVNLPLKLEDPQRMHVVSHTWGLDCLLIGCFDGEILKISDNYSKLSVLFNPADELTSHDYLTTVDFMGNVQKDWSRNMEHMLYHKKHLYTGGSMGFLSVFEFNSKGHIQWTNMYNEELNISSMILCKDHIMIGTREGRIQLHDPEKINQFTTVTNESSAEFVGFKPIYPGNTYAASARVNGLINIWEIKSGEKISEINLNKKICCLDCNPTTCIVIFGLHDGHIVVVDTQDESSPQIVNTSLICSNPICYLRYDSQSIYFFVLSANKMLFIIDGSIKNRCKVYGFVELPNYLISLTTYNSDGVKVYIPAHTDFVEGSPYFNKLIFLYIDPNFKTDYKSFYMNNMCQIDPEKLRMNILLLTSPASGLVITGSSKLYTTFENTMELVHINYKYDPELMPVGVWEMSNQYSFPNFAVSSMCTSYDKQWVIIATQDGSVHVFLSANMSQVQLSTVVLDYHNYDMKSMSMTWDCDYLLTLCTDGTASCFTINYDVKAATKTQRKLTKEWFRSIMKQPSMTSTESESSDQMEEIITNLQLETEVSWLEKKQKLALEEKELEVAEEKQKIRESINVIRNTVCEMLKTNEERPDIEKLEPYEFDLDVEEQARLLAEGEATILKIYQNTEYDNLAKIFIKDKIKEECYDQMFKKGQRTEEELKLLQRIEYKRKIEKIVDSVRIEF
ncbi:cilia- and flagella-associated protein 43-like [Argonauta hians]